MDKYEWEDKQKLNIVVTLKSGETVTHEDVKPIPTKKEKQPEGYEEGIDLSKYEDELTPFIQDGTRFKFTQTIWNQSPVKYQSYKTKKLIVYREEAIAGITLEKIYKQKSK